MLCIEIWSLDSTEHIQVNATWVSPMLVWTEEDSTRIEISAELFLGIEVTCKNVSEEIEISATFTPKIEVWTSYVCYIGDFTPMLEISPTIIHFPSRGDAIRKLFVQSNLNWIVDTK